MPGIRGENAGGTEQAPRDTTVKFLTTGKKDFASSPVGVLGRDVGSE